MLSPSKDWALHAAFLGFVQLTLTWFNLVSGTVPEPYLDEFFHVPQAQKYCNDDYSWDPKITTPPGLYLFSKLARPILGCDTSALRFLNTIASWLILPLCYSILRLQRYRTNKHVSNHSTEQYKKAVALSEHEDGREQDTHSAVNIALFPPLIFFSALYYTDLISTLLVLLSHFIYLRKTSTFGTISWNLQTVLIGILALFFRQTNIFWVAIFPAGLTLVDVLKGESELHTVSEPAGKPSASSRSWDDGVVCDYAVQDAVPEDYVRFSISLIMAALRRPITVVRVMLPYIVLLLLFAAFVVWNGSVVLGDKNAHTATIHIPQMLYIWPYIAFFSFPLLLGPLLAPVSTHLPRFVRTIYSGSFVRTTAFKPSDLMISLLFIFGGLVAVHYNTIIHPYTLADNRHYVFYVFRIIRRHRAIRYLAVPIYYGSAWLAIRALQSPPQSSGVVNKSKGDSDKGETGPKPCQISFFIVWIATTALSVITAPLVEPRYFILPWIMWRLHVANAASTRADQRSRKSLYDVRLPFETIWLLAINVALGHTFLYRTFTWPNEPDNLQRFIW